jgi:DNA-binding MarR family transcriptional regulator
LTRPQTLHREVVLNVLVSLEDCYCFAVRQAARRITRMYEKHLAAVQLTSAQFSILMILKRQPGMTMAALAAAMAMDRTTLLRAVKPLKRDRLLLSKPGESDTRQLLFSLSEPGQRKIEAATRLWQNAQSEFEARIGVTRAARIRRDLLDQGPRAA